MQAASCAGSCAVGTCSVGSRTLHAAPQPWMGVSASRAVLAPSRRRQHPSVTSILDSVTNPFIGERSKREKNRTPSSTPADGMRLPADASLCPLSRVLSADASRCPLSRVLSRATAHPQSSRILERVTRQTVCNVVCSSHARQHARLLPQGVSLDQRLAALVGEVVSPWDRHCPGAPHAVPCRGAMHLHAGSTVPWPHAVGCRGPMHLHHSAESAPLSS